MWMFSNAEAIYISFSVCCVFFFSSFFPDLCVKILDAGCCCHFISAAAAAATKIYTLRSVGVCFVVCIIRMNARECIKFWYVCARRAYVRCVLLFEWCKCARTAACSLLWHHYNVLVTLFVCIGSLFLLNCFPNCSASFHAGNVKSYEPVFVKYVFIQFSPIHAKKHAHKHTPRLYDVLMCLYAPLKCCV